MFPNTVFVPPFPNSWQGLRKGIIQNWGWVEHFLWDSWDISFRFVWEKEIHVDTLRKGLQSGKVPLGTQQLGWRRCGCHDDFGFAEVLPVVNVGSHTWPIITLDKRESIVRLLRTSGKFGHAFANSGNPDETAPRQDFHCLFSQFIFYSNN